MGQQQDDIRVVMGKPAVLGLFGVAAGVSNAHVRGHNGVGRARVTLLAPFRRVARRDYSRPAL